MGYDTRYHVNPKSGNPGICTANRACPFGGEEVHFSTRADAAKAYEYAMAASGGSFAAMANSGSSATMASRGDLVSDGDRVYQVLYPRHSGHGLNVVEVNPSGITFGDEYIEESAMDGYRVVTREEANNTIAAKAPQGLELTDVNAYYASHEKLTAEASVGDIFVKDGKPYAMVGVRRNDDDFTVKEVGLASIDGFGVSSRDVERVALGQVDSGYRRLTDAEREEFSARFDKQAQSEDGLARELDAWRPSDEEVASLRSAYMATKGRRLTEDNYKELSRATYDYRHCLDRQRALMVGNDLDVRLAAARNALEALTVEQDSVELDAGYWKVSSIRRSRSSKKAMNESSAESRSLVASKIFKTSRAVAALEAELQA